MTLQIAELMCALLANPTAFLSRMGKIVVEEGGGVRVIEDDELGTFAPDKQAANVSRLVVCRTGISLLVADGPIAPEIVKAFLSAGEGAGKPLAFDAYGHFIKKFLDAPKPRGRYAWIKTSSGIFSFDAISIQGKNDFLKDLRICGPKGLLIHGLSTTGKVYNLTNAPAMAIEPPKDFRPEWSECAVTRKLPFVNAIETAVTKGSFLWMFVATEKGAYVIGDGGATELVSSTKGKNISEILVSERQGKAHFMGADGEIFTYSIEKGREVSNTMRVPEDLRGPILSAIALSGQVYAGSHTTTVRLA